jgi:hypothetical protein
MLKKVLSVSMVVTLLLAAGAYFPENAEARGQGRKLREKVREQVSIEIYKRRTAGQVTVEVYGERQGRQKVAGEVYGQRRRVADAVYNRVYTQREFARIRAAEIKRNQRIIKALNRELQEKMQLVRQTIKELREEPELFPAEKEAAVREQLRLIRENRARFAETLGEIREERALLKENRKQSGPGLRGNVDNIFAVQEARIRILREMIADIDELLALLR